MTIFKLSCHLPLPSFDFWADTCSKEMVARWNICNVFLLGPKTKPVHEKFSKNNSVFQVSGTSEINTSNGILNTSQVSEGSSLLLGYCGSQFNNSAFQLFQLATDICNTLLYCNKITDLFVSFENSDSLFLNFPQVASSFRGKILKYMGRR